ncbi:MAG: GNAT family N-acetyltransferase [Chloroflexota bacterium]
MRHPDHDRLVATVRSWYTTSAEEMGYEVVPGPFGWYGHQRRAPGITPWALLDRVGPLDATALLAELRARHGPGTVRIEVDDPARDREVGPILTATGCRPGHLQIFLAHLGPVPPTAPVPDLSVETVGEPNLEAFVITKLKAFASRDDPPDAVEVRVGMELRRAELAGVGRFLLARIRQEPAAILGLYDGPDQLIFNVATRLAFRRRGIASHLIGRALSGARARGGRSVIINADPEDRPIQLYRRLGFTDEVYWRRQYTATLADR